MACNFPIGFSYWLADTLGSLYYFWARKDRKIAQDNLRVVIEHIGKSADINYLSRLVFINFARYLVEFFRFAHLSEDFIKRNIEIIGINNLEDALKMGKGVILVSAHLGNWELGAVVLSMLGYPINVVAWTHKNRLINNFFLKQRRSKGVRIIPLGSTIRRVFSVLKENELVAFLGDIDYTNPNKGIKVTLFGKEIVMPKGPALFSLKTKAPLLPLFILREKGNKFKFFIEKPILSDGLKESEDNLTLLTQKLTKKMEAYIWCDPSQWFMLTPRWVNRQPA